MPDTDRDLLPEGLEDRLPASAAMAARVTRAVIDVMDSHGYDRVQPPSIEFEKSLASRMAGISPRRMFRFVDPASLRTLALRSDITPQVGRIAATALAEAARPLRLCYAGQVVIIKGDGLDPTRERLQLGAELIGSDSVAAAGEVVAMAIEALGAAGASGHFGRFHPARSGRPARGQGAAAATGKHRSGAARTRRQGCRRAGRGRRRGLSAAARRDRAVRCGDRTLASD